jgi:hypothetical protein
MKHNANDALCTPYVVLAVEAEPHLLQDEEDLLRLGHCAKSLLQAATALLVECDMQGNKEIASGP